MKLSLVTLGMVALGDATISITNQNISRSNKAASYSLLNTGEVSSGAFLEYWIDTPSLVGRYEARATKTSGDNLSSGTLNTWLNLSTNRVWKSNGYTVLSIEIREVATGVVQDSATITLERIDFTGGTD